jgi:hypothetical protein
MKTKSMSIEIINTFLEARRRLAQAEQLFHEARAAVLRICPPGESRGPVFVRLSRIWKPSVAAKQRVADLRKELAAAGQGAFTERPAVYVLAEKQAEETVHE